MRQFNKICLLAVTSAGFPANAPAPPQPPELPPAALAASLKGKAGSIATAKLSPVFAALADGKVRSQLTMSDEQIDLARRLEALTRDIIRYWLFRGLEDAPPPSPAVLGERLSEPGVRLRNRLVVHAEAIVMQGILSQRQSRALFIMTGRKVPPLLPGRNGQPITGADDDERPAEELSKSLRNAVGMYRSAGNRAGHIFQALLGTTGFRAMFPNGAAQIDRLHQVLLRRDLPRVELTVEQFGLCERLNNLVIDVWGAWMTRDLNALPLPPQHVLARRLSEVGGRVRNSLFAHAEAVALDGIATPEQADRCLMAVWERLEMRALLDPALASRVRLSGWQRDQVVALLDAKQAIADNLSSSVACGPPTPRGDMLVAEAQERQAEVDALFWDLLSPAQARFLARILNKNHPDTPRPEPKKK